MTNSPPLVVQKLNKSFGLIKAVRDLDLMLPAGEVFGFLGPNGAGKTTTVKMLLGLVKPTSGQGEMFGYPLGDHRGRVKVGYLPEQFHSHEWLTGREFLRFHGSLCGMSTTILKERIPKLLETVALSAQADRTLRGYSKGMLQRIALAQAIINDPHLIILDEPTSGLDPAGRKLVRDLIRDWRSQGKSVLLNSHSLSEVEILCDRVAFINRGHIIKEGPLHELMAGQLFAQLRVRPLNEAVLATLRGWSSRVWTQNGDIHLELRQQKDLSQINRQLIEQGIEVSHLSLVQASLEDVFFKLLGHEGCS
jgi:ABC-2 type transport system ATP-binding protein